MSELKFACPVCGQHLTASSADSGQQIDCPTCFQKLLVPQPRSGDSKLVLNASKVEERRRLPAAMERGAGGITSRQSRISASVVVLLLILGGLLYALFANRKQLFSARTASPPSTTNATVIGPVAPPVPVRQWPWNLDIATAFFTNAPAQGRVRGQPFETEWATVQGGTLILRQGRAHLPDLTVAVYLNAAKGEDLGGKTIVVTTNRSPAPFVQFRWKDDQQKNASERIRGGYAMKIIFDQPANGRLPGRIWLSTPDENLSFISGAFDAEIRKAPPRKPAKKPARKPAASPP